MAPFPVGPAAGLPEGCTIEKLKAQELPLFAQEKRDIEAHCLKCGDH